MLVPLRYTDTPTSLRTRRLQGAHAAQNSSSSSSSRILLQHAAATCSSTAPSATQHIFSLLFLVALLLEAGERGLHCYEVEGVHQQHGEVV